MAKNTLQKKTPIEKENLALKKKVDALERTLSDFEAHKNLSKRRSKSLPVNESNLRHGGRKPSS